MKIFKPKMYVTDPKKSKKISEKPKRFTPICWDVWEVDRITIEYSKEYQRDMPKMGPLTKKQIRSLIEDLKKGYLYTNGPKNKSSDTHVLKDKSNKEYIVWSKSYSTLDRVTYSVFEPVTSIVDEETNKTEIVVNIVIMSCKEHKLSKEKRYTEGEGQ